MKTRVKICGIRSFNAAKVAINAGANYLGFNFVGSSPRRIDPEKAREIINKIRGKVNVVGVFQNAYLGYINTLVKDLNLDFVQLHGAETPEFSKEVASNVIKAISLSEDLSSDQLIDQMKTYSVDYFLFDRATQGKGEMVSSKNARIIAEKFPIFLAGGLNVENVAKIVREVKPFAVDVAGGVETDGAEDLEKIEKFISNVNGVIL